MWDAALPGFGLRVTAGGKKSWVAMYHTGGRVTAIANDTPLAVDAGLFTLCNDVDSDTFTDCELKTNIILP